MKVLIIEDEKRIVEFLKKGLKYKGFKVTVASDGDQGIAKAQKSLYDVVLLDLMLPGEKDGFMVCEKLRQEGVKSPIIMLTARGQLEDKVKGLDVGADDYLTKPFDFEELLARINSLVRRTKKDTKATLRVGNLTLDPAGQVVKRGTRLIKLSQTEYKLLHFLMLHKDEVINRGKVLEEVWEYDFDPHSNIVDVYMRYLRRKIDRENEPRLIHTIRGRGYKLSARV